MTRLTTGLCCLSLVWVCMLAPLGRAGPLRAVRLFDVVELLSTGPSRGTAAVPRTVHRVVLSSSFFELFSRMDDSDLLGLHVQLLDERAVVDSDAASASVLASLTGQVLAVQRHSDGTVSSLSGKTFSRLAGESFASVGQGTYSAPCTCTRACVQLRLAVRVLTSVGRRAQVILPSTGVLRTVMFMAFLRRLGTRRRFGLALMSSLA